MRLRRRAPHAPAEAPHASPSRYARRGVDSAALDVNEAEEVAAAAAAAVAAVAVVVAAVVPFARAGVATSTAEADPAPPAAQRRRAEEIARVWVRMHNARVEQLHSVQRTERDKRQVGRVERRLTAAEQRLALDPRHRGERASCTATESPGATTSPPPRRRAGAAGPPGP